MKTIIAGSRGITDYTVVHEATKRAGFEISVVISGTAKGADKLGEGWANMNNIPIIRMPANWNRQPDGTYDKAAGHKRNAEMAGIAEACIVMWDGESPGSRGMILLAVQKGIPVYVYNTKTGADCWYNTIKPLTEKETNDQSR